MKTRTFCLGCSVVVLLAFFFVIFLLVTPVHAKGKVITFEQDTLGNVRGEGLPSYADNTVRLTLTEYKPDIYTVTGTLHLRNGQVTCPIKGNYHVKWEDKKTGILIGKLHATAYHPEQQTDIDRY